MESKTGNNKISHTAPHNLIKIAGNLPTSNFMSASLVSCPLCDKPFKSRNMVLDHMKQYHKNLSGSQCPYCPKSYIWSFDLNVGEQLYA